MIDLHVDVSSFDRLAKRLGGASDQVPFALANALTSAAFRTREALISETWPSHVTVRSRGFMRAALRVERATKSDLNVAITTEGTAAGMRGNLGLHAAGGTKHAKKGRLAIPPSSGRGKVTRTAKGVRANQTPRALVSVIPKRALRVTDRGIFEGKGGRLMLRYSFKSAANQRADVPFRPEFARFMVEETRRIFPAALARAMRSRRAR